MKMNKKIWMLGAVVMATVDMLAPALFVLSLADGNKLAAAACGFTMALEWIRLILVGYTFIMEGNDEQKTSKEEK